MNHFFINVLPNLTEPFKKNRFKKSTKSKVAIVLLISAISILSLLVLYSSYRKNARIIQSLKKITLDLKASSNNQIEGFYLLKSIFQDKQNWPWQSKIYPSSYDVQISDFINSNSLHYIKTNIIPGLVVFLERRLIKNLHNNEIDQLIEAFRVYLIIYGLEPSNIQYVKDWYLERLDKTNLTIGISKDLLKNILNKLTLAMFDRSNINNDLYTMVLNTLTSQNLAGLIYQTTVNKFSDRPQMDMALLLPKSFFEIFDIDSLNYKIPFLYTKEGYKQYLNYQVKLLKTLTSITYLSKVLDKNNLISKVEDAGSIYIKDYASYWNEILSNIRFKETDNLADVLAILKKINSDTLITFRFLQQLDKEIFVSDNENLANPAEGLLPADSDKLNTLDKLGKLKSVNINPLQDEIHQLLSYQNFEKEPSEELKKNLINSIKELTMLVSSIVNSLNLDAASFYTIKKLEASESSPITEAEKVFAILPEPINLSYGALIDNIKQIIYAHANNYINDNWQEIIYKFYVEKLQNRYPIDSVNYNNQLSLKDFVTFFAKDGILETFRVDYLSLKEIVLNQEAYRLLELAKEIRANWFNAEGQLKVQFVLAPTKIDDNLKKVSLLLLGQEITFTHDKFEAVEFVWPIQKQNAEYAKIEFVDKRQSKSVVYYNGLWSWYKALGLEKIQDISTPGAVSINSISTVLQSPVGNFEFSVTFDGNLPLLGLRQKPVPEKVIGQP